jgi:negative regulator of sigma E activity
MLRLYIWLADAPLINPKNLNQSPSKALTQDDPLVAHGWTSTVTITAIAAVLLVAVIVGVFSRKVEYALITALGLSLVPIVLFFLAGR